MIALRHDLRPALRHLALAFGLGLGAGAWAGPTPDEFRCASLDHLAEYPSQLFVYRNGTDAFSLTALLPPSPGAAADSLLHWLEVAYSHRGVRFTYRLPEVGLPLDLYNVRTEVLDREGRVVAFEQLWPSDACVAISLFPGQGTPFFKVPLPNGPLPDGEYRVRVRALGTLR